MLFPWYLSQFCSHLQRCFVWLFLGLTKESFLQGHKIAQLLCYTDDAKCKSCSSFSRCLNFLICDRHRLAESTHQKPRYCLCAEFTGKMSVLCGLVRGGAVADIIPAVLWIILTTIQAPSAALKKGTQFMTSLYFTMHGWLLHYLGDF